MVFDDGIKGLAWDGLAASASVVSMLSPRWAALEMRICSIAAQVHGGGLASLPGSKQGQEPGACPGVQHRGGRGRQQAAQPGGPRRQLLGTPRIAPRRGVVTGRVVVSEPAGLLGMPVAVTLGVLALWSCPWPGRSVRRCGLGGVPFLLDLAEVPD